MKWNGFTSHTQMQLQKFLNNIFCRYCKWWNKYNGKLICATILRMFLNVIVSLRKVPLALSEKVWCLQYQSKPRVFVASSTPKVMDSVLSISVFITSKKLFLAAKFVQYVSIFAFSIVGYHVTSLSFLQPISNYANPNLICTVAV